MQVGEKTGRNDRERKRTGADIECSVPAAETTGAASPLGRLTIAYRFKGSQCAFSPKRGAADWRKCGGGKWEVLANLPPVRLTCNLTSRSYRGAPLACGARSVSVRSADAHGLRPQLQIRSPRVRSPLGVRSLGPCTADFV